MDAETTFVDTNILVYAHDATESEKQPIARALLEELWADRTGTLSAQLLQEFYNAATRKRARPMTRAEARQIVDVCSKWPVVVIEPWLILTASRLEERHQLSFWDALVIAAARVAGARRLLTEDMQDGRVVDGIRIHNPFAA